MTYTPTTGNVRAAYERDIVGRGANTSEGAIAEFNRWLQNVKAEVWDEARNEPVECCGSCPRGLCPWDNGGDGPTNPYVGDN